MEIDVASLPPEIFSKAITEQVLLRDALGDVPPPIAWAGGECPVPASTLVQIQCAFETAFDHSQPPRKAGAWAHHWRRDHGDECGITHYLVVEL